jgi:hypothetical protein
VTYVGGEFLDPCSQLLAPFREPQQDTSNRTAGTSWW